MYAGLINFNFLLTSQEFKLRTEWYKNLIVGKQPLIDGWGFTINHNLSIKVRNS